MDTMHAPGGAEVRVPEAGAWVLDTAHTRVGFAARYMMLGKVRGHFATVDGTVRVGDSPETSEVEVTMDASSIDTNMEMRDDHLRSPDFLDVETYPTLTFRSTAVEKTGPATGLITGDLTIKAVTRPVVLEAEYLGMAPGPDGSERAAFSARGRIDREEWGIIWNVALETGGWLVGPTVDLEIEVMLTRGEDVPRAGA
ncbi:MAG TPA: YceI family protein [Actinomycetota bacterium]|jgi:polyisoprenoid-binding protein YceI